MIRRRRGRRGAAYVVTRHHPGSGGSRTSGPFETEWQARAHVRDVLVRFDGMTDREASAHASGIMVDDPTPTRAGAYAFTITTRAAPLPEAIPAQRPTPIAPAHRPHPL